ncbi:MAG TPA: VOC family protein [Beijerinckiaceae bacterium]|jgi:catechol 2,3-dioxygenase-like lactoylglutathione lyase family enzyme|nr:VOC family protein [Beijerinckiaceae bacterium]
MAINCFSHVAFRCRDAKETVDFYSGLLGLRYHFGVAADTVASTGEHSPHIHIFFEVAPNSYLAFFELPEAPDMQFDPNTPRWVQHTALTVPTEAEVLAYKKRLETAGIEVVGVTDHGLFKSIYFFDPNGYRTEITCETFDPKVLKHLEDNAWRYLEEWTRTKRAPEGMTMLPQH